MYASNDIACLLMLAESIKPCSYRPPHTRFCGGKLQGTVTIGTRRMRKSNQAAAAFNHALVYQEFQRLRHALAQWNDQCALREPQLVCEVTADVLPQGRSLH